MPNINECILYVFTVLHSNCCHLTLIELVPVGLDDWLGLVHQTTTTTTSTTTSTTTTTATTTTTSTVPVVIRSHHLLNRASCLIRHKT